MHTVYQKSYPLIYLKLKKKYNRRRKKINEILAHPISMYMYHGRPSGFFYIGQILAFGAHPRSLILLFGKTLTISYTSRILRGVFRLILQPL